MKTKLFLVLWAFVTADISSQTWFSVGQKWTYSLDVFDLIGYEQFTITGDTVINGIDSKVFSQKWLEAEEDIPGDSTIFYFQKYGYEENEKVYFYYELDGQFHKNYDFTLDVGDTMVLTADGREFDTFIVHEVGNVHINSQSLKYQKLNHTGSPFRFKVIEKLGYVEREKVLPDTTTVTNYGYLFFNEKFDCVFDDPINRLRCYSDNLIDYNPDNIECDTVIYQLVGSKESNDKLEDAIIVSPNPATDEVFIKIASDVQIENLTLFSSMGEEIMALQNPLIEERLDLSDLSKGIYFIRWVTNGNQIGLKWMVIL